MQNHGELVLTKSGDSRRFSVQSSDSSVSTDGTVLLIQVKCVDITAVQQLFLSIVYRDNKLTTESLVGRTVAIERDSGDPDAELAQLLWYRENEQEHGQSLESVNIKLSEFSSDSNGDGHRLEINAIIDDGSKLHLDSWTELT